MGPYSRGWGAALIKILSENMGEIIFKLRIYGVLTNKNLYHKFLNNTPL